MPAGYSTTPLIKKLGIKEGFSVAFINPPPSYMEVLGEIPPSVKTVKNKTSKVNLVHYFVTRKLQLIKDILPLRSMIQTDGMIWISWPKKSSKQTTDLTEDIIREIALQNRLVDVKVCAVDEVWSGLKLVIPVKYRNMEVK